MANFLLIGGRFDLDVGANSICIRNIAYELKKRGHNVFAITNSWNKDAYHEIDGLKIWGVKQTFYDRVKEFSQKGGFSRTIFFKIFSFVRRFFLILLYPNVAPLRCFRIIKLAKKLVYHKEIDAVISFYRPIETLYCGMKLKSILGNKIYFFCYHLDLLSSNVPILFNSFFQRKIKFFFKKEYNYADSLILPEFTQKKQSDDKMIYTGFPVCIPDSNNIDYNINFPKDKINVVYIGSLDCCNRNPVFFMKLLNKFNQDSLKQIVLHIWGFIDESVKKEISQYNFIKYNGLLKNIYSLSVLKQSDFVLNIGNKNTYLMLPSKIFKSFLSGKPIINIVKNKDDISLRFFNEYGHSLNIIESMFNKDNDYKTFCNFILSNHKQTFNAPKSLIEHNSPCFIVDKIEEKIFSRYGK